MIFDWIFLACLSLCGETCWRYYFGGKADFGELRYNNFSDLNFSMEFPFRSLKGIHDASIWSAYGHMESAQFRCNGCLSFHRFY